jgi:hypothetical protein
MQQITRNAASLKRLVSLCRPALIARLVPLLWRVAVVVRSFFRPPDHAPLDGPTGTAAGERPARDRPYDSASHPGRDRNRSGRGDARQDSVERSNVSPQPPDEEDDRHTLWPDHAASMVFPEHGSRRGGHRPVGPAFGAVRRADDARVDGGRRPLAGRHAAAGGAGRAVGTISRLARRGRASSCGRRPGETSAFASRRGGRRATRRVIGNRPAERRKARAAVASRPGRCLRADAAGLGGGQLRYAGVAWAPSTWGRCPRANSPP